MSIAVKFYTFSKKKNSTKTPTGGTIINCYLLDETSVTNPSIRLSYSGDPTSWNYAYIGSFNNRYYFITDWISDHNQWIATLVVDVLASYKYDILSSTQYVLRSASERNPLIADASYPMDTAVEYQKQNAIGSILPASPFSQVRYILAISNGDSFPKVNGVQYLCCDQTQLNAIMYGVLNSTSNYWDADQSSGISDSIFRSICNPLQYFGEAYLLPVIPDSQYLSDVTNGLKVGSWNVPYSGTQLKAITSTYFSSALGYIYRNTYDVTLPAHPQLLTHGDYVRAMPYSKYYLYAGPFGVVQLDTSTITNLSQSDTFGIQIQIEVDFKGGACLTVFDHTTGSIGFGAIIAKEYANVAVPITLTQTKNNTLQWLSSFAGAASNAASGNVPGTIGGAANLISGTENLFNKPETRGLQGATSVIYEPWYIQSEFHKVVCRDGELPMNIIGYPLCETRQLSTLSGFCQTSEPWLDIACYASEYNEIMGFMTDGFYIEATP